MACRNLRRVGVRIDHRLRGRILLLSFLHALLFGRQRPVRARRVSRAQDACEALFLFDVLSEVAEEASAGGVLTSKVADDEPAALPPRGRATSEP